jgi:hypothetical protein
VALASSGFFAQVRALNDGRKTKKQKQIPAFAGMTNKKVTADPSAALRDDKY